MGQTTSTEVQSNPVVGQTGGPFGGPSTVTGARTASVAPLPQFPTLPVYIKNSTSGTLYVNTTTKNKLTLASGKTGIVNGLCSNCSVFVYTDSQRSNPLVVLPYNTFMDEARGKTQPVLDIGLSSKIIDGGTFISSSPNPTMMNTTSYPTPMMNTTTPTAFTPRPTINATLINPTTMKR